MTRKSPNPYLVIAVLALLGMLFAPQRPSSFAGVQPSPFQILQKLVQVERMVIKARDRMDAIAGARVTPPIDDGIPVLVSIKDECDAIIAIADEMLDEVRGVNPRI